MLLDTTQLDARLQKTGAELFDRMVKSKSCSLRAIADDRNQQIRFYRWINHEDIDKEQIINTSVQKTSKLVKGRHVLAIQDTTEINYEAHSDRVYGLGTVGNGTDAGIFLHPLLVIDAETGQGLGFGAIHTWNRFVSKDPGYKRLPIECKESYRWIETAEEGKKNLTQATCITFIGDRENDIYEFLDRVPDENTKILVRARDDRNLDDGSKLYEKLDNSPVKQRYTLKLPNADMRKNQFAEVELRYQKVLIKKPNSTQKMFANDFVELTAVQVKEVGKKSNRVNWCLLTTHEICTTEEAKQVIYWYKQRWQIEQLFRTLKSQGVDIESSQLEMESSLTKLVIISLNAALRIMQLVLARDGNTSHKTDMMFDRVERTLLTVLLKKVEGNTEKQKNPYPPDNLAWASWIIGRLGGWKGYKSEGKIGPITMGRGLTRFYSMLEGFLMVENTYTG